MKREFKKINKVMIGFTTFGIFLFLFILFAENTHAALLATLPGTGGADNNPSTYLSAIYNLTIGIAGVLSVLMIVIGGVEYIGSAANPSLKIEAKKRIWAAIGGLLLALTAYLILQTINPDIMKSSLSLPKIKIKENEKVSTKIMPPNPTTINGCRQKYSKVRGDLISGFRQVKGWEYCSKNKFKSFDNVDNVNCKSMKIDLDSKQQQITLNENLCTFMAKQPKVQERKGEELKVKFNPELLK